MEGPEIGIVETRNIIRILKEKYNLDYSNHALTSLKRRLERCILINNLKNAENLILKLTDSPDFINKFQVDIAVESTEMFRDPSLWRWLRDEFLPEQIRPNISYSIWLPECVSGDELFTLCTVLNEAGYQDKVKIIATSYSQALIDRIRSGELRFKKIDTSSENYTRFHGIRDFTDYYNLIDNTAIRDVSMISLVEFRKHDITEDAPLRDIKLILFRNRMIYYNPTLQSRVLAKLHQSLSFNGHLVIGTMENLVSFIKNNEFTVVNQNENVFKKRG
ncbi:MAG: CheR family methyltransferase [Bacteroidota bacterium]